MRQSGLKLIAYTGLIDNPSCKYAQSFGREMEYVSRKLSDQKVIIAMTNASYLNSKNENPIAVFYRDEHKIPITWSNEGFDIAIWVSRIVQLPGATKFTSKAEYDILSSRFKTIFCAYINVTNDIEGFNYVAQEFNAPFVYTDNVDLAKKIWQIDEPSIFVIHNWKNRNGRFFFAPRELRQADDIQAVVCIY